MRVGALVVPIARVKPAAVGRYGIGGGPGIVEHSNDGAADPAKDHALNPAAHKDPANHSAKDRTNRDRRHER